VRLALHNCDGIFSCSVLVLGFAQWTKLHTVTRLLLPRWGSTGQHRLLLSASLRGKVHAEEFRTPMISQSRKLKRDRNSKRSTFTTFLALCLFAGILDQLHRIALILTPSPPHSTRKATPSNEEESKENEPMTDGAGGLDLVRTLQEQCGFSSTATVAPMDGSHLAASNAAVMLRWLHHSRQAELSSSNRSNRFEDYLVRTTKQSGEEAIQVHVTSKHTMTGQCCSSG
jgi:hypothetical protein